MKRQVVLTPTAQDDAQRIGAWWRSNRPAAPRLFTEELSRVARALGMILVGDRCAEEGLPVL